MNDLTVASSRLQRLMEAGNFSEDDIVKMSKGFADKYGVTVKKTDVRAMLAKRSFPSQKKIQVLADVFHCDKAFLQGSTDVKQLPFYMPPLAKPPVDADDGNILGDLAKPGSVPLIPMSVAAHDKTTPAAAPYNGEVGEVCLPLYPNQIHKTDTDNAFVAATSIFRPNIITTDDTTEITLPPQPMEDTEDSPPERITAVTDDNRSQPPWEDEEASDGSLQPEQKKRSRLCQNLRQSETQAPVIYVLDISVLISFPDAVARFSQMQAGVTSIPVNVLRKLSDIILNGCGNERDNAISNSRQLNSVAKASEMQADAAGTAANIISYGREDDDILSVARALNGIVVSCDPCIRLMASNQGIKNMDYLPADNTENNYAHKKDGIIVDISRTEMETFSRAGKLRPTDAQSLSWSDGSLVPGDYAFECNDFIQFRISADNGDVGAVCAAARYDGMDFVAFSAIDGYPNIKAKALTFGQQYALNAMLMDSKEMPLVILQGPSNCGKLYCTVLAAVRQTVDPAEGYLFKPLAYKHIVFVTQDGYATDRETGILREIMESDNLEDAPDGFSCQYSGNVIQHISVSRAVNSHITRSFVIVDMAQDLSLRQIKDIILAVDSFDSKLVLVGDPEAVSSPFITGSNNGLKAAATLLRNCPGCSQYEFSRSEQVVFSALQRNVMDRFPV